MVRRPRMAHHHRRKIIRVVRPFHLHHHPPSQSERTMAKVKGTLPNQPPPTKKLQLLPRYRYVRLDKQGHIAVIRRFRVVSRVRDGNRQSVCFESLLHPLGIQCCTAVILRQHILPVQQVCMRNHALASRPMRSFHQPSNIARIRRRVRHWPGPQHHSHQAVVQRLPLQLGVWC